MVYTKSKITSFLLLMSCIIHFESESLPNDIKNEPFELGKSSKFEFFENQMTQVYLIDTKSNVDNYIKDISSDSIIFVDFEFVPSYLRQSERAPPICIFAFQCSKGIYIFKQTNYTPNESLKNFLSVNKFIGYSIRDSLERMKKIFGDDFSMDITDISKTYLKAHKIPAVVRIVEDLFCDDILVKYKNSSMKKKNWNRKNLSYDDVCFVSFYLFLTSRCYQRFAGGDIDQILQKQKNKKQKSIKKVEIDKNILIRFNQETPLEFYRRKVWPLGSFQKIELFPGKLTQVGLFDAIEDFGKYESEISKSPIIALDIRFTSLKLLDAPPVCVFTFCSSSDVYVFLQRTIEKNERMKNFLSKKNGLKFIGKEIDERLSRMKMFFGDKFEINYEDIDKTVLKPNNKPTNYDAMINSILGQPCAVIKQYKHSDWNSKRFTVVQVARTAIWTLSIFNIYQKLIIKKNMQNEDWLNEEDIEFEYDDDDYSENYFGDANDE